MTSDALNPERRAEISRGLDLVRTRIRAACESAGRAPDEVTLIVVTKTYSADDVRILRDLGVENVGENRDQEAALKHADCHGDALRWHLVGRLQTNKCRSVARWANVVHSLDRMRVVDALGRAAVDEGRALEVLIQVSLDGDPDRGGAPLADVPALADRIAAADGLALRGLMAVAPLNVEPAAAFDVLAQASDRLRAEHPLATWISAGMSGDLEAAITAGATHVRVGSAVLGARPALR